MIVEEEAGVALWVLRREELKRHRDHDRAEDHAAEASEAAQDHDGVDRDENRDVEVPGGDGCQDRPEHAAREGRDPGADGERESLSRFTGMLIAPAARGSSVARAGHARSGTR